MSAISDKIRYHEHAYRNTRSPSELAYLRDKLNYMYDEQNRYYAFPPPMLVSDPSLLRYQPPEKTMKPETPVKQAKPVNAAIAALLERLKTREDTVRNCTPYVTAHDSAAKDVKEIKAALKKLGYE